MAVALAALGLAAGTARAGQDDAQLWRALASGGHFALLRHALAPGTGDPRRFVLGDCATQRNLSQAGRDQARRIGSQLRENGVGSARVYSSQWCRTLETARLLDVGEVTALPALNSFFESAHRGAAQTRELTRWLAGQDLSRPLVLVTHQVNITALTGVYPASGEMVVVSREPNGTLRVAGTVRTE